MKTLTTLTALVFFMVATALAQTNKDNTLTPAQVQSQQDENNLKLGQQNIEAAKEKYKRDLNSKDEHIKAAKAEKENIKNDKLNLQNDQKDIKTAKTQYKQTAKDKGAHDKAAKAEVKNMKLEKQKQKDEAKELRKNGVTQPAKSTDKQ